MMDTAKLQRYFRALQGRLPEAMQEQSTQRWLFLYFSIVGESVVGEGLPPSRDAELTEAMSESIMDCWNAAGNGGFTAIPDPVVHASTTTGTHCALHILKSIGALDKLVASGRLDAAHALSFVKQIYVSHSDGECCSYLLPHGAFRSAIGSVEADVRFAYSALMTIALLRSSLHASMERYSTLAEFMRDSPLVGIDPEPTVRLLLQCQTYEGGFSGLPGQEAHGGMTYCAAASLALLGALDSADVHALRRYCVARLATFDLEDVVPGAEDAESTWVEPTKSSSTSFPPRLARLGFQGRANKDCDTCYTYWYGCTLRLIDAADLIDAGPLAAFVSACQCEKRGGVCKNDGTPCDPMHSCLGASGLAAVVSTVVDEETRAALGVASLSRFDPLAGAPFSVT